MTKVKIDPKKWYSLSDIVRDKMFPWRTSFWAVRNVVAIDGRNKNILKPTIQGTGRGTKYLFKGDRIIKFVEKVEAGEVRL